MAPRRKVDMCVSVESGTAANAPVLPAKPVILEFLYWRSFVARVREQTRRECSVRDATW
jgi:hypothetical protein